MSEGYRSLPDTKIRCVEELEGWSCLRKHLLYGWGSILVLTLVLGNQEHTWVPKLVQRLSSQCTTKTSIIFRSQTNNTLSKPEWVVSLTFVITARTSMHSPLLSSGSIYSPLQVFLADWKRAQVWNFRIIYMLLNSVQCLAKPYIMRKLRGQTLEEEEWWNYLIEFIWYKGHSMSKWNSWILIIMQMCYWVAKKISLNTIPVIKL